MTRNEMLRATATVLRPLMDITDPADRCDVMAMALRAYLDHDHFNGGYEAMAPSDQRPRRSS